ncbi:alpha/beta hydrolase family protein [Phyllobacterium myrsinacearum]|uniref:Putative dienelactone hydrolase n=1 Tax=Phyllobacterium myrsinacearum TaxID=28101 RepID=A0A839EC63_9HYPH|nr:alpha/beta fold hydrolase [Phyllobacterium myrsinacearum]MBA8876542.1 putative dienelactone hydrolase [Phyllobacterium myrsinacearum]
MKLQIMLCAVAISALATTHMAHADNLAGVRQILVPSKERGTDLDVTVWYPAQAGGEKVLLGDTPLFMGTAGMRDAPPLEGKFPLILLSHGTGIAGNAQATSWIAAPLAQKGYIVAAPNHPGNQSGNKSASETMKLWLRPSDFTATLDALKTGTVFQNRIDWKNVGALGLSMGGYTALAVAGARIDQQRLTAYCDTDLNNHSLCEWLRLSRVDLHKMDLQPASLNYQDTRIRSAVAIDPAMSDTLNTASIAGITIPVDLVNLGRKGEIPFTAQASWMAEIIPDVRYANIEDANHFSMFAECKADASDKLKAQDIAEALCDDDGGRSRSAIHAQLIEMIGKVFNRTLKAR